jgi:electron transport complex protein RnfC
MQTADPPAVFAAVPIPRRIIVPLSARPPGEGTSAKPPEARVARGEALADNVPETAFVPLSPVNGRIVATTRVDLMNGQRVAAVEIEVDPSDAKPQAPHEPPPESSDLATWIDRIRRAGIWAERRNGPDLLAQLHQALRRPCDTVICTALDGEDAAPLNSALASAYTAELIAGVRTIGRAAGAAHRVIGMAMDAPAGDVARVRRATNGDSSLRVVPVPHGYPQTDPTLMLYTLLRRRLRPGRLPAEMGAILIDAPAAVAVGRLALRGEPMVDVPMVVRDVARNRTHRVTAAVGTPLWHVLEHLGASDDETATVPRAGDALRDQPASRSAVVSGGELVVHVGYASAAFNPDPCIRCGWCTAACPTRIHPAGLLEAAQRQHEHLADRYGIDSCIECGVCSYVCPSRLPLLGAIRHMRSKVRT